MASVHGRNFRAPGGLSVVGIRKVVKDNPGVSTASLGVETSFGGQRHAETSGKARVNGELSDVEAEPRGDDHNGMPPRLDRERPGHEISG